jgi:uncharacterized protein YjbI with pentapeptide repeats
MEEFIQINKTFEKVLYTDRRINGREFDGCVFKNCDFSNSDFSDNVFIDCEFIDCNLAMTKLRNSSLKSVVFTDCKLLGIEFHECADFLFQIELADCVADYSSFANKKMQKSKFSNCSLKEVTFAGADLTKAVFDNCNLENAIFNNTQLKEADFRTARNYKIDPELNPMRKAKFAIAGIQGLLEKYDIKID